MKKIKRKIYAIKKGREYLNWFSFNDGCCYGRFNSDIYLFINKKLIPRYYNEEGNRVVRLDITESEV